MRELASRASASAIALQTSSQLATLTTPLQLNSTTEKGLVSQQACSLRRESQKSAPSPSPIEIKAQNHNDEDYHGAKSSPRRQDDRKGWDPNSGESCGTLRRGMMRARTCTWRGRPSSDPFLQSDNVSNSDERTSRQIEVEDPMYLHG